MLLHKMSKTCSTWTQSCDRKIVSICHQWGLDQKTCHVSKNTVKYTDAEPSVSKRSYVVDIVNVIFIILKCDFPNVDVNIALYCIKYNYQPQRWPVSVFYHYSINIKLFRCCVLQQSRCVCDWFLYILSCALPEHLSSVHLCRGNSSGSTLMSPDTLLEPILKPVSCF